MMSGPNELRAQLVDLANRIMPGGVGALEVEPSITRDGDEFLLVTIQLKDASVADEMLEKVLEDIEAEVAKSDERYPSVRFLDAA